MIFLLALRHGHVVSRAVWHESDEVLVLSTRVLDSANHPTELSAYSYFLRDGDDVFHTYSTFGRGTEMVGSAYDILDLSALGRQEDWEEPTGRADKPHDADPSFGGFAA